MVDRLHTEDCTVIIPARAGSQRVPHKNFLPLHPDGRNAVQLAVDVALEAGFRRIVVSTDLFPDKRRMILPVWWDQRPPELATSETPMIDVVKYLIAQPRYQSRAYLLLQPTQPLRQASHLQKASHLLTFPDVDSVVTIGLNRFVRDGTAYLFWAETVKWFGTIYGAKVALMPVPAAETCPLDTQADWAEAERRLRALR